MSTENQSLPKDHWPYFGVGLFKKPKEAKAPRLPTPDREPAPEIKEESAMQKVESLLISSPDMSAATFLNLLKSQGFDVIQKAPEIKSPEPKEKAEEAEGGSTNAAVLRAQTKESASTQAVGAHTFRCRFVEALSKDDSTGVSRFRVVLIQEGLGNMRDGFFYTKEALASGVQIFEGKKIYADHPSAIDEQSLPERSVKDILGHFEAVRLEEGEGGQAILTADVVTLPDEPYRWARALMRHAVAYSKQFPDKEFVGLSINASGSAKPMDLKEFQESVTIPEGAKLKLQKAIEEGLTEVKVVERLESAVSCDLVTEAGAGGKVLAMLEQEKKMDEKQVEQKQEEKKEAMPHADEEQDIALIKKMLKDYLGDEDSEKEEIMAACKQAMEAYVEMGKEKEEAIKSACEYMKASKHMAEKAQKESDDKDADDKEEPKEEKKEGEVEESAPAVSGDSPGDKAKHIEALAELKGENARLKESLKKHELADHIEKVCRESKESRQITDEFRKLVEGAKSKGEIDKLWDAFSRGSKLKGASVAPMSFADFVLTEKKVEPAKKAGGFGDCLK